MSDMLLAAGDSLGIDASDIPNVFTPNGDELNDYFEVETPAGTVYDFRIFTRTGIQIYYSNSPRIFWDGRNSGGNEVTEGIYYYVIELSENSSEKGLTGFVYLYR
jgi:gliding motility-associated-like protein